MSSSVAGWRASHVPGRWPVLMGPSSLVVVDASATTDLTGLWEKVVSSASMAELVAALAVIGPDQSPDLVALFWSPTGMRSLVRGNVRLVDPSTAEVIADGAGMLTWREVGLDDRAQIEIDLGAGPVGSRGLPLVVGAVRAGAVRVEAGESAAVLSPQATSFEQTIPPDEIADWPAPDEHTDNGSLESSEIDPIAAGAIWPPANRPRVSVPVLSPTSDVPPNPPPTATSALSSGDIDVDPDSPLGGGLTRRTSPPTVEDIVENPVEVARHEMENGDTELMAPAPAGPIGDQDVAGAPSHRMTPLVVAVICVSGHPNPPYVDRCALCGAPVPPQSTQLVPRPVLGILRSPDGASTAIDRPILIGRAPVQRDDLAEVPELMRVPSPGQDISRTHLMVSPDQWEILLTDLHSTNGTVIVRPGPGVDRLQLQPGEPMAVTVGTVVELGDGVAVLVDGPPHPGS